MGVFAEGPLWIIRPSLWMKIRSLEGGVRVQRLSPRSDWRFFFGDCVGCVVVSPDVASYWARASNLLALPYEHCSRSSIQSALSLVWLNAMLSPPSRNDLLLNNFNHTIYSFSQPFTFLNVSPPSPSKPQSDVIPSDSSSAIKKKNPHRQHMEQRDEKEVLAMLVWQNVYPEILELIPPPLPRPVPAKSSFPHSNRCVVPQFHAAHDVLWDHTFTKFNPN